MFLQRTLRSLLKQARLPMTGIAQQQARLSTAAIEEEKISRYATGGYHPVRIGDTFKDDAYKIVNKLGFGQYSTVWLAYDKHHDRHVAMKILTADALEPSLPIFELDILRKISHSESQGSNHILRLLDDFNHKGPNGNHACLIFKVMGIDMSRFLRFFPNDKILVPVAKKIARQLLLALAFLHESKVIHCDIKPQNILLETENINAMFQYAASTNFAPASIPEPPRDYYIKAMQFTYAGEDITTTPSLHARLSDLGVSSWYDKHLTEWIQPHMLRAPEVTLGAPWDWTVDMWNLGTVLWELIEGDTLFDGSATPKCPYTPETHLAQMTAVLGKMPDELLKRGEYTSQFFDVEANLRALSRFPSRTLESLSSYQGADKKEYLEFMSSMLQLLPEMRPSATELLKSPWLLN